MNSTVKVELFEEHNKTNYYSIIIDDANSEFEKFLINFPCRGAYKEDMDTISYWIDHIGENGAIERYFRPEGNIGDNLRAIPMETCNLRVFILRISDNIIILGNGSEKTTLAYNDDPKLNRYAITLQKLDVRISDRIESGRITINGKKLKGDLVFKYKI